MKRTTGQRKRYQLERLFDRQHGLCFWCNCKMQPPGSYINVHGTKPPKDLCTYDHLDDRHSPDRGKHKGEFRNVAACWECNFTRGREDHLSVPIEQRHEMSKRHPRTLRARGIA